MSNPLDYFGLPLIFFILLGTYFFGDFGLVFGVIIGGGIGLLAWNKRHQHIWEHRMLYDERGEPQLMVKFCRCGEIMFNGLVSTKRKSNVGYDVKVYEKGHEEETIRGLTYGQVEAIKRILARHKIKSTVIAID